MESTKESIEILKSKSVLEMLTVAHEFCIFTEAIEKTKAENVLSFYQKILPLLYLKASLLPEIEVSDEFANERFVNEEDWQNIFDSIKEKLGEKDTFFSLGEDNQIQKTSFADHVSDIYQDLKDFVLLFQKNRIVAQENALFECKKLFENHWGERIPRLIQHIHDEMYSNQKENDYL